MRRISRLGLLLIVAMAAGCLEPELKVGGGTGGTRAAGDGGLAGAGGGASSGKGGSMASGGSKASGGSAAQAGTRATGGGIAGASGTIAVGGTTLAGGGMTIPGGNTQVGGATDVGGTTKNGGSTAVGGVTTVGGITMVGGSTTVGGITTAGGTTALGGSSGEGGTGAPDGGVDVAPPMYTLSVTVTGSGTVTSTNEAGISCGTTCSNIYSPGAGVVLSASANPGVTFAGWSGGGCSGTATTCTVTVSSNTTVAATFTTNQYALTVSTAGPGSGIVSIIKPTAVSCGMSCSQNYNSGTQVTLEATIAAGSIFSGWTGGGCGTGLSCTVTITAATTLTANFILAKYKLTVKPAGTGSGLVSSTSPTAFSCSTTCPQSYDYGTIVSLSASANTGSTFDGWSGVAGCTDASSCKVTITADTTVTAAFTTACDYYVSVSRGYDTYAGTFLMPFQTITHAMSVVPSGKTVRVLPGTYVAPPETFPIAIPPGVQVFGDSANNGVGPIPTLVSGSGSVSANETATFTLTGTGSALYGFKLSAPDPRTAGMMGFLVRAYQCAGVIMFNTFNDAYGGVETYDLSANPVCPTVGSNTFNTVEYGVHDSCRGQSTIDANVFNTPNLPIDTIGSPRITDNMIDGSGMLGIQNQNGVGSPSISDNTFIHSGGYTYGAIVIDGVSTGKLRGNHFDSIGATKAIKITGQAVPDLGTVADPGGNTFGSASITVDPQWTAGQTIYMIGNFWGSSPTCGSNIIFSGTAGSIVWDNGAHCP